MQQCHDTCAKARESISPQKTRKSYMVHVLCKQLYCCNTKVSYCSSSKHQNKHPSRLGTEIVPKQAPLSDPMEGLHLPRSTVPREA